MSMLTTVERDAALRDLLGSGRSEMISASNALRADASSTAALIEYFQREVRVDTMHAIMYALCGHADPRAWDLMMLVLADHSKVALVRGQAAEGLGGMFSEVEVGSTEFNRGVSVLLNALKDPAEEVRYFALFALSATGYLPLISAMKELLSDHTPVPGWRGTVADEAKDAIEWLETVHASRVRRGKPDH